MKCSRVIFLAVVVGTFSACRSSLPDQTEEVKQESSCQGIPGFLSKFGVQPHQVVFSTSERTTKGLVLREANTKTNGRQPRRWQHPSWGNFGWMGSISTAQDGSLFVVPTPVINTLYNPPEAQTILYRVDSKSGVMEPFTNLPPGGPPTNENPYGLIGVYADCMNNVIYVSSIAGSTRSREVGKLFAVSGTSGHVVDTFSGIDAIGLAVSSVSGEKRLYFGTARASKVESILLDELGRFVGEKRIEVSLAGMGPRGDDRARRIRFDSEGVMRVHGIEFHYNLTAPTEKLETVYKFYQETQTGRWIATRLNMRR